MNSKTKLWTSMLIQCRLMMFGKGRSYKNEKRTACYHIYWSSDGRMYHSTAFTALDKHLHQFDGDGPIIIISWIVSPTSLMTSIPDDRLFSHSDRVKGKVVVITGPSFPIWKALC